MIEKTCGQCAYLWAERKGGKYCHERGITGDSSPCQGFRPDVSGLRRAEAQKELVSLFPLIRQVPAHLLAPLSLILMGEKTLREHSPFHVLQPVVLNYQGTGEYLSDYCYAYILDMDVQQQVLRTINKDGTFIASFPLSSTSILSLSEFAKIKAELKQKKKKQRPPKSPKSNSLDSVPTIDTVVQEKKISQAKLRKLDLTTLFKLTA